MGVNMHSRLKSPGKASRQARITLGRSEEYGGFEDGVEQAISQVGKIILARGRSQLSLNDRAKIDSALVLGSSALEEAIRTLKLAPLEYVEKILSSHFIGQSSREIANFIPSILRRFIVLKNELGEYRSGHDRQNQIAKIKSESCSNTSPRVLAFVSPGLDRLHRRLFLTEAGLESSTIALASTIIHELSHHFLSTDDIWYNNYSGHVKDDSISSASRIIKRMARTEKTILNVEMPAGAHLWQESKGKKRMAEIWEKAKANPAYANKIVVRNADSIVSIIFSLARRKIRDFAERLPVRFPNVPDAPSASPEVSDWL